MISLQRKLIKSYYLFSIKKQKIINASYDTMIDLIRRQYNMKQYKNTSALALLEIHHQYQIFNKGDWVLDIGAGPQLGWTDLALKLTNNNQQTNYVISNDIQIAGSLRSQNTFIRGNFSLEQIQTKIGMKLVDKRLNTILVDVSPQYTGSQENDGQYIHNIVSDALQFSDTFLTRGGNFVCKMLQCQQQQATHEFLKISFNQVHKYLPSIIRKTSPIYYFVAKGFLMNQSYHAVNQMIKRYNKTVQKDKKVNIVKSYQKQYLWNAQNVIKNMIKQSIKRMKAQNYPNQNIIYAFMDDPFVNVQQYLKQLDTKSEKRITTKKIMDKILHLQKKMINKGKVSKFNRLPDNKQELYNVLDKQNRIKRQKKQPLKQSRKLLAQNQIYMKNLFEKDQHIYEKIYVEEDLTNPAAQIDQYHKQQLQTSMAQKLIHIYPQFTKDKITKEIYQSSSKKYKDLSKDIFSEQQRDKSGQQLYNRIIDSENTRLKRQYDPRQQTYYDEMNQRVSQHKNPYSTADYFNEAQQQKKDRFVNQKRSTKRSKY